VSLSKLANLKYQKAEKYNEKETVDDLMG